MTEVKAALEAHGFSVQTLLNPTRDIFDRTIRRFISQYAQTHNNRILIYFAGHGHTIKTEDNMELGYIVPVEAPNPQRSGNSAFKEVAISMSEIDGYARQIESKHALFVFDSCFSGSIFDATRAVPPAITEKTSRPVRQFITAGTGEQTVPDKSIFCRQFIEALKGEGDLNGDGFITGSELGFYLEDKVANYTERSQTPQWGKIRNPNLDKGDFVFALRRRVDPEHGPPPQPVLDPEEEAWKIVAATRNPEVVREYLKAYPNGRYASNARIKLKDLEPATPGVKPERPPVSEPEKRPVGIYTSTAFTTGRLVNGNLVESQGNCDLYVEDLGNGVRIEMVRIPGGKFLMGSSRSEKDRGDYEGPQREVSVNEYLMGRYEVRQKLWRTVAGYPKVSIDLNADPSRFKGDDLPVETVSWNEAKEFVARLNKKMGLDERTGYRLLSEAEWEYAARAGTTTPFAFGATINPEIVNYNGEYPYGGAAQGKYRGSTSNVGSLEVANGWGLFDMHGNVYEWCEDDWHSSYNGAPVDGRAWVDNPRASGRVFRGGSWSGSPVFCRSANRSFNSPAFSGSSVGFRLSRTLR